MPDEQPMPRLSRVADAVEVRWWTSRRTRLGLIALFVLLAIAGVVWWWVTGSSIAWWIGPLLALPLSLAATARRPGSTSDEDVNHFAPMEGPYTPP